MTKREKTVFLLYGDGLIYVIWSNRLNFMDLEVARDYGNPDCQAPKVTAKHVAAGYAVEDCKCLAHHDLGQH